VRRGEERGEEWEGRGGGTCSKVLGDRRSCIQGQIFRVWGVNMGQISIFHFITPKGTSLRDFASFEPFARQNPSRGLFATLVREKKRNK